MDKERTIQYREITNPGGSESQGHRVEFGKHGEVAVSTLRALRDGEEWAYNEVYNRFASPLKDFIAILIRNEEDAKELNHDVFLSLWADRDKIVPEKGIKRFLFMRAKNLAMNYFDRKKVKDKYISFCNRNVDYDFAPDQYIIGDETKILIEIALKGMSERKRAIFKMKYEQGKSVEEIAAELNLSQSTVRNNLTMIMKAIKEVIAFYLLFLLS